MADTFQNFMNDKILFVRNRHMARFLTFVRDAFNPHKVRNANETLIKTLIDNQK